MYRKPRFLELLHEIREQMSRECDYDMDLFAERINSANAKSAKMRSPRRPHKMVSHPSAVKPKAKARRKA